MKEKYKMIITITEAAELKKEIKEKFSADIHFHDGCGGQYFTLDEPSGEIVKFIDGYFAEKNMRAVFSGDCCRFSVEK